jgi:1,4-alpha-glucan branching enzyme
MKHKPNQSNVHGASPPLVPVHFEFIHSKAATVCVAGSFNDWQPDAKPMHGRGDGHWWKDTVLSPGTYEYCLVVDGQWMPDPQAAEFAPNPFGGWNSVLRVAFSPDATHLDEAENLPLKSTDELNVQLL